MVRVATQTVDPIPGNGAACRRVRRPHDERCVTLVESLVAVGLFLMAAAAVNNLLMGHIRFQGSNTRYTTAIAVAERELENLRGLDYKDIASHSATQTVDGGTYTTTTTVQDGVPIANLKSIVVSVGWSEPSGAKTYAINAIYTAIKR
jgi:type II secretory pathway pseudopilin PulG